MLWYLIPIPLIVGYIAQSFCRLGKNTGKIVKFRPPSIVFAIVWPILYIMLGTSWMLASQGNMLWLPMILYSLLAIFLGLWIVMYGCVKSKTASAWILVVCIALVLGCFSIGNVWSKLLLAPLLAWLIFATIMNTTEVQNE